MKLFFCGLIFVLVLFIFIGYFYFFEWEEEEKVQLGCLCVSDQKILEQDMIPFMNTWHDCSISSKGSKHGTIKCLQNKYPSLSKTCATCFGNYVVCTSFHCLIPCLLNSNSQACFKCANENCFDKLLKCTRLPPDHLPHV